MKLAIIDLLGLTYDGNTLNNRGLGGSESAVIYMSRELAKIGFNVTVYNNCDDNHCSAGVYDGVRYIDHSKFTDTEKYDIVISSRSVYPFFARNQYAPIAATAKHKVLWMHDTFCDGDQHIENMLTSGELHEVFTLSDFHTSYVGNSAHGPRRMFEVMKKFMWQTRNGAVKHIQDIDLTKKDRNHFVYNASATKGLIPLLGGIWPEVKKQIPNARLTCIGGFYRFREGSEPDEQEKTVRNLMDDPKLKELDVTFTGVIKQDEIAKILANASFMLYPPDFPETFGISSLESLLYKTPIITSYFGALEETAVDLACYKIDYPAVPNGLFPHINADYQINQYVHTTVRAYKDTYLHQQKQEYCSVVDDIAGWDTVALQWKQHFYRVMGKYLSVDEYRKVTRINDKVARVYGRRFTNPESLKQYRSYGRQKRITVISPFFNAANYIEKCIMSVAQQDYENYQHILIDDCSTDNSRLVAYAAIKNLPPEIRDRFLLIKNQINVGAIRNQIDAFNNHVGNNDIVMLLDGDDWLVNNNTIFHYYNDLYNQGYDFTYGSMWSEVDNIPLIAQDYKNGDVYRDTKFSWGIPYTHLRTFLGETARGLDEDVFKDKQGKWMMAGADAPLFYELIERSEKPKAVKEIMVHYNDKNPLNDYKVRPEEQNRNAGR